MPVMNLAVGWNVLLDLVVVVIFVVVVVIVLMCLVSKRDFDSVESFLGCFFYVQYN